MAVVDELLQVFARSLFAKAKAIKSLTLSRNQHKRLRATMTAEIRAAGGLLYPEVRVPEVSEAALRMAESCGVQMCAQTWTSQYSFDKGRRVFHWEHVDPISCIQKACMQAESEGVILNILSTRLRIAWILKDEDRKLTQLGYRSKRPDPDAAYRAAGIVLVKRDRETEPAASPGRVRT